MYVSCNEEHKNYDYDGEQHNCVISLAYIPDTACVSTL